MAGVQGHLRTLMVAGGCADAAEAIPIDRETLNINEPAAYTLIRFSLATDTECQGIAHEPVCIETSNAVAIGYGGQIDQVHQRIALIERLALQHAANQGLRGRPVARRVFAAGLVDAARGGNTGHLLQRLRRQLRPVSVAQFGYFLPQGFTIRRIDDAGFDTGSCKFGTYLSDFFRYDDIHNSINHAAKLQHSA